MTIPLKHLLAILLGVFLLTDRNLGAAVAASRYPNLYFSASDIPSLRARAGDNSLGKQAFAKLAPLFAEEKDQPRAIAVAAWATKYLLTGYENAAAQARTKAVSLANSLGQIDRQKAKTPGQLGFICDASSSLALAYDLCHTNWPEQDQRVVEAKLLELSRLLLALSSEKGRSALSFTEGVGAAAAGGIAALSLRLEPRTKALAAPLAMQARQQVGRFVDDCNEKGWPREGLGALRLAFRLGLGEFLLAWRKAQGEDLFTQGTIKGWASFFPLLLISPSKDSSGGGIDLPWYGPRSDIKGSVRSHWLQEDGFGGDLCVLLALADAGSRTSLQWTFNHCFGAEGNGSYDIARPSSLLLLLTALQGGDTSVNPVSLSGHSWGDASEGFYLFRNQWKDSNDAIATIKANQRPSPALRSSPDSGSFRLLALGGKWAVERNRDHEDLDAQLRERENVVIIPGTHGWHAGQVLRANSQTDGSGAVVINLDKVYTVAPPGASPALLDTTQDLGIRVQRAWAIDYSGDCGAPVLMVVVDECHNGPTRRWLMHTEEKDISLRPDGFDIRASNGSSLHACILAPDKPRLSVSHGVWTDSIAIDGEGSFFVVMTVQPAGKEHPKSQRQGSELNASISLGDSVIRYDGADIAIR